MIGITRGTTKANICRAALDAITFNVKEVIDCIYDETGVPIKELRVDGGASSNNLLMQLQADVLNTQIVRPKITETTALGAAYLAGLSVGYWNSLDDVKKHWHMDKSFVPGNSHEKQRQDYRKWKRAVERSKSWMIEMDEESKG